MFKVGDKVVKTNPKIRFEFIREVKGVFEDGSIWLDYTGYKWKPPKIRHATPEEIAAGHRIDGFLTNEGGKLETLRDCDISPNCKKFDERVNNND